MKSLAHGTRRETLEPPPGRPRVGERRDVVVVGGGLAGCAAAAVLAERGVSVTLLEREEVLGGRVSGWTDRLGGGEPFQMERGFHAFFRQYYNLRAFLRRVDPDLERLRPLEDYPLLGPGGRSESFAGLPGATPWNVLALVRRTPSLGLRDLIRVDPWPALEMLRYEADRTHARWEEVSAKDWLDAIRFPRRARQMLFEVFAHSFFNPEETMSAAEMLRMFHFYFTGNPEGLVFDVLDRPFSTGLWEPMRRHLESLGVDVRLGAAARRVERDGERWRVRVDGGEAATCDGVALAVTVPALRALVDASPDLGDPRWRRDVSDLTTTLPFAVWRLWLDRDARPDRQPFAGTAGMGLLDNISLYHRIQDESAAWAARTGGAVVELHGYAIPEDLDEQAVRADLWRNFVDACPELRGARVEEERFLLRRDCPGFERGTWRRRPGVEAPHDGLVLAGDFVRLPIPAALMEGAVASGLLAANHLLARWGVRGEPVETVPRRGILAPRLPLPRLGPVRTP
ncbi:MAG: FAD-dependent oxidoreductase [Myxococcota bacterium]